MYYRIFFWISHKILLVDAITQSLFIYITFVAQILNSKGVIIIKNYNYFKIFLYVVLIEILGFLSGFIVNYSDDDYIMSKIGDFMPPGFVFGIVWTILYAALGFIAYLVFNSNSNNLKTVFIFHMLLNFSWSYVFFGAGSYAIALFIILMMIASLMYLRPWLKTQDKFAFILSNVYLVWLLYAFFLNFMVAVG